MTLNEVNITRETALSLLPINNKQRVYYADMRLPVMTWKKECIIKRIRYSDTRTIILEGAFKHYIELKDECFLDETIYVEPDQEKLKGYLKSLLGDKFICYTCKYNKWECLDVGEEEPYLLCTKGREFKQEITHCYYYEHISKTGEEEQE